jgi:hypothetical protein
MLGGREARHIRANLERSGRWRRSGRRREWFGPAPPRRRKGRAGPSRAEQALTLLLQLGQRAFSAPSRKVMCSSTRRNCTR